MFCPGCGKQISAELNFCNSCGINLHAVQQVINTNTANFVPTPPAQLQMHNQSLALEKTRYNLKKAGLLTMGLGLFVGISLEIIGDALHLYFLRGLSQFGGLFIMMGIMILLYRRIMYGKTNSNVVVIEQTQLPTSQPLVLPSAQPNSNFSSPLPPGRPLFQGVTQSGLQPPVMGENSSYPYPPPTITEHTTKELKPPKTSHNPY
jgi:hypothetical protein